MSYFLGCYSDESIKETRKCDVFILYKNASGVPYAYLPFQKVFMSLSNEEMKQYYKNNFLKGATQLSKEEYKELMEV